MRRLSWSGWVPAVVLVALAVIGLPHFAIDPDGGFRLPAGDPIHEATVRLEAATGGDDLVGVVLFRPEGIVSQEGVTAMEAAAERLRDIVVLREVRGPQDAPILQVQDGTTSAISPLSPPPTDPAGWERARALLADSPFVTGALLGEDQQVALVLGWVDRGSEDTILARLVGRELAGMPPDSAVRGVLGRTIDDARLAVAMGDAPAPVDAEVTRRLLALPGEAGTLVDGWQSSLRDRLGRPDRGALQALEDRLAATPIAGVEARIVGPWAIQRELTPRFARWIGILLGTSILAAILLGPLTFRQTLLRAGWALLAPTGVVGALALRGPVGALDLVFVAATPLLAVATLGGARTDSPLPSVPRQWGSVLYASAWLLVLLSAVAWLPVPRPQSMLSTKIPAARGASLLADHLGLGPAWVVLHGGPGEAMNPERVAALDDVARRVAGHSEDSRGAGWPDYLRLLQEASGGSPGFPATREAIEQGILVLGRPQDLAAFTNADRSIAVSRAPWSADVKVTTLAREAPSEGVMLAGRRVEAELAPLARWIPSPWGAGPMTVVVLLLVVVAFLLHHLVQGRLAEPSRAFPSVLVLSVALASSACWPGAWWFAGPAAIGTTLLLGASRPELRPIHLLLAGLAFAPATFSSVLPVRGAAVSGLLGLLVGALAVRHLQREFPSGTSSGTDDPLRMGPRW